MEGDVHKAVGIAVVLASLGLRAQMTALAAGSTNVTYTSGTETSLGLTRQTVAVRPDGTIADRSGTIVTKADAIAVDMAAREVKQISDRANDATTNALQLLLSATGTAAHVSQPFRLVFEPESERDALTSYVVDVETDGTNDTLHVWYNRSLSMAPNRSQTYHTWEREETVKGSWADTASGWSADGAPRTVNGRTWSGVHRYVVRRPAWARGIRAEYRRNDTFGASAGGFGFGSMIPTVGGVPAYSGYVTNSVTGERMYFLNGFLSEDQGGGE